jgi:hypothetical protein
MSLVEDRSQQKKSTALIYRLHRWFFAVCVILGMVATLALVLTNPPYYSVQNGVSAMVATCATANPVLMQAHFLAVVSAVYLVPLSLLAMAWLAMGRSPWLASIAMLVVLIGMLPAGAFPAQDALTYDLVRMGSNPLFLTILQRFNNDGVMSYDNAMFLVGTVLGPTLVGIALWRAKAVPTWAAVLITFGRLLTFLYPLFPGAPAIYVQLLSWVPLFIGSIPAALAVVKAPNVSRPALSQPVEAE